MLESKNVFMFFLGYFMIMSAVCAVSLKSLNSGLVSLFFYYICGSLFLFSLNLVICSIMVLLVFASGVVSLLFVGYGLADFTDFGNGLRMGVDNEIRKYLYFIVFLGLIVFSRINLLYTADISFKELNFFEDAEIAYVLYFTYGDFLIFVGLFLFFLTISVVVVFGL